MPSDERSANAASVMAAGERSSAVAGNGIMAARDKITAMRQYMLPLNHQPPPDKGFVPRIVAGKVCRSKAALQSTSRYTRGNSGKLARRDWAGDAAGAKT